MKLLPRPINYKDTFLYEGNTYYQTHNNKYLMSVRSECNLPIFKRKDYFYQEISKKEFMTAKVLSISKLKDSVKKGVQLTLF